MMSKMNSATGQPEHYSKDREISGLVLHPHVQPYDGKMRNGRAIVDNAQIRFALLYWDKLAWTNMENVDFPNSAELNFLEQQKVLEMYYTKDSKNFVGISYSMADGCAVIFRHLSSIEPNTWSILDPSEMAMTHLKIAVPENADAITLFKAIPIPSEDVSLDDVIMFKERRRDELQRMRGVIRSTYAEIRAANDRVVALEKAAHELDVACADVLRVAREWRNPFNVGDLKFSLDVSLRNIVSGLGVGDLIGKQLPFGAEYQLPFVCGALGVGMSCLKISQDVSVKKKPDNHPYRYVYHLHKELFV